MLRVWQKVTFQFCRPFLNCVIKIYLNLKNEEKKSKLKNISAHKIIEMYLLLIISWRFLKLVQPSEALKLIN